MKVNAFDFGKGFAPKVDIDIWKDEAGIFCGSLSIGELYYEADRWFKRENVIRELKGYLAGIKEQIENIDYESK